MTAYVDSAEGEILYFIASYLVCAEKLAEIKSRSTGPPVANDTAPGCRGQGQGFAAAGSSLAPFQLRICKR